MFNYGKAKVRWEWRVGGTEKSEEKVLGKTKGYKKKKPNWFCRCLSLWGCNGIIDMRPICL